MSIPRLPGCEYQPAAFEGPGYDEALRLRREYLPPSYLTYYERPLMLVEGRMQYVWDEKGRRYLDAFGGIVTVGVDIVIPTSWGRRTRKIWCCSTPQRSTCIPPSGDTPKRWRRSCRVTENLLLREFRLRGQRSRVADGAGIHGELRRDFAAQRLSRRWSGHNGAHGQSTLEIQSAAGLRRPIRAAPYAYRGAYGYDDAAAGAKYAADVQESHRVRHFRSGRRVYRREASRAWAGWSVPRWLSGGVYAIVRAAGGVCIADEVQSGFGRTGEKFWGFELQAVVPDIVTMAKSIGNGCALAAVVTTPKIAEALRQRVHFNTFGGGPVACAQGLAVLEVIEREKIQSRAKSLGARLRAGLLDLLAGIRGSVTCADWVCCRESNWCRIAKQGARQGRCVAGPGAGA